MAVAGTRALVAVDDTVTEPDGTFGAHAGRLLVVDLATRTVVRTIDTGGQPDSVKVGPTGKYAVVAIESKRRWSQPRLAASGHGQLQDPPEPVVKTTASRQRQCLRA